MALRVLVCGGRDYENFVHVRKTLDLVHRAEGIAMLIHGGAGHKIMRHGVAGEIWSPRVLKAIQGADLLAEEWAIYNRIPVWGYPVPDEDWLRLGKKAGPLRNQKMLDERKPELCVHFPGGRGTADMVGRVIAAGVDIYPKMPDPSRLTDAADG